MFFFSKLIFKKLAPRMRTDGLSYGNNVTRYLSLLTDLFLIMIIMRFYHTYCMRLVNLFSHGVDYDLIKKVQLDLQLTPLETEQFHWYKIKASIVTLSQLIIIPFYLLIPWYYLGGSIGQILLGLRIVQDDTGESMTTKLMFKRFFAGFLTVCTLMIGFLWSFFDKKRQSLHDKIVKTVVITKRSLKQKGIYKVRLDIFDDWILPIIKKFYLSVKMKYQAWKMKNQ